jgi:hypothetical protein
LLGAIRAMSGKDYFASSMLPSTVAAAFLAVHIQQ